MWAHVMSVDDYQDLIGKLIYANLNIGSESVIHS